MNKKLFLLVLLPLLAMGQVQPPPTAPVIGSMFVPTGMSCPASGPAVITAASNQLVFCTNGSVAGDYDVSQRAITTSGQIEKVRVVTAAGTITQLTSDRHICVNKTTGAATAVNLQASPPGGLILTIDDCKGDAATNNITITPAAGTIDSGATYLITTNYGSVSMYYTGTIWKTTSSR